MDVSKRGKGLSSIMGYSRKDINKWVDKLGTIGGLIILLIFFSITADYFFTIRNWFNITNQVAIYGLMAIAMTFPLISGGIDLSAGSTLGLAGVVCVYVIEMTHNIVIAIIAALLVGLICGIVNGLLVTRLKLNFVIATLGTMFIYRGFAFMMTDGLPQSIRRIGEFTGDEFFSALGTEKFLGFLPYTAIILVITALILSFFLNTTVFARHMYATGSDTLASSLSGINTNQKKLAAYIFCSLISALAGVVYTARMSSATSTAGYGYELEGIAAAFIGGASIFGGTGSMSGAMIGAFIIGIIRNGLNLLGVDSFQQQVVIGVVIILAVYYDRIRSENQLSTKYVEETK
jgi:ribose transport system permease protein